MPATASATNVETIEDACTRPSAGETCRPSSENLSDDVRWEQWENYFPHREDVAWLAPRQGRDGAAEFFGVAGSFEIAEFQVAKHIAAANGEDTTAR